jgi:hypothetical protein
MHLLPHPPLARASKEDRKNLYGVRIGPCQIRGPIHVELSSFSDAGLTVRRSDPLLARGVVIL